MPGSETGRWQNASVGVHGGDGCVLGPHPHGLALMAGPRVGCRSASAGRRVPGLARKPSRS